jgi:hypothetical protein
MDTLTDIQSESQSKRELQGKGRRIAALFCTFWYALFGWLHFYNGLRYEEIFTTLNLWPRPLYIILSGLAIGSTFTVGIFLIFLRAKITPTYMKILGMVFLVWLWFDNIWLGTREAFFNQVIITFLITLITVILIFILLKDKDYHKGSTHDSE